MDSFRTQHPFWAGWKALLILVLLAAAMRVIVALLPQVIHTDGAFQYLPAAQRYSDGGLKGGLAGTIEMPLLPISIALMSNITGNLELAGRLVSLLAGIATVVPLFLLARNLFGGRVAFVSGVLFACAPLFVTNSSEVTKESLFGFLFVTAMWLGWIGLSRLSLRYCMAGGVAGALAYLTRADGLDLFVVWGVWLGAGFLIHAIRRRKRALNYLLAGIIIAAPTICLGGMYVLYLHHSTGKWTISLKKPIDQLIAGKETGREQSEPPMGVKVKLWAGRSLTSLGEIGREMFNELKAPFFLLLLIGLLARRQALFAEKDRYLTMLCAVQLAVAFLIVIHFSRFDGIALQRETSPFSGRHLLSLLLAAWCWVGCGCVALADGIAWLASRLRRTPLTDHARAVASLCLVSVIFVGASPMALKGPHADKMAHKEMGLWLRKQDIGEVLFLAEDRRIAYYAGLQEKNVKRPSKGWERKLNATLDKARADGIAYVNFSADNLTSAGPQIEAAVSAGRLRLVHRTSIPDGKDDALYELTPLPH